MNAAELAGHIVEGAVAAGTDTMFGIPGGGANLQLIGAAERAGLRFVLAHTETAAVMMAAAYADVTGALGLCVVTRGPGAASAVNGAAQALLDRQPVLIVTDTVGSSHRRRISHQALDQISVFGPVTKWSSAVGGPDAAAVVRAAVTTAVAHPPGPVHLDFDPSTEETNSHGGPRQDVAPVRRLPQEVIELLGGAQRPILLVGAGGRLVRDELRALCETRKIPALATYRARGVIPDSSPHMAGLLSGAIQERTSIAEADLILTVGLDTVELIPGVWDYSAPVVSLSDHAETHPYFVPAAGVVGELGALVTELREVLDMAQWPPGWGKVRRDSELAECLESRRDDVTDPGMVPQDVVALARAAAPHGTVATVDAGAHMLVAMPLWSCEDVNEVLISSGLATMGYALPAATGAALARPDRHVVCFVGDGGLGMCAAELETLAREVLPVVVVVFNDSLLSLIALKQTPEGQGGASAVRYRDIDYALVAEGFGIRSVRVEEPDQLQEALTLAFGHQGPTLIDVRVNPAHYQQVFATVRGG